MKDKSFLNVCLHQQKQKYLVGELAHVDNQVYFEYSSDFIDTQIELSPFKLPLQTGIQVDTEKTFSGLPGVFNDSLPDGWGMLLMDRYFRKNGIEPHKISPLQRLAYIGNRGMGALCYEPASKIDSDFQSKLALSVLAQECEEVLRGDEKDILPELIIAGGSPGGARPKVLIGYNEKTGEVCTGATEIPDGFNHYVVKFSALTDFKDIGVIEYAYTLMASEAGINLPPAKLFDAGITGIFFGTERFDRKMNNRIHMHTLSGLLHADYRIPNCDYTDFLKTTWLLTKNQDDTLQAFRRMVFNITTHNRDDHTKNFAFLLIDGQWKLSPAYDLTFSTGVAGEHTMTVSGEGANPSKEHILNVAKKLDIPLQKSTKIIEEVLDAIAAWSRLADEAGVSKDSKVELQRALNNIRI